MIVCTGVPCVAFCISPHFCRVLPSLFQFSLLFGGSHSTSAKPIRLRPVGEVVLAEVLNWPTVTFTTITKNFTNHYNSFRFSSISVFQLCSFLAIVLQLPSEDCIPQDRSPPDHPHRGFTRQPDNSKHAHVRVLALQTPPKFHEQTHRETQRERNGDLKMKKKREILGPPPFGPPTLRTPTSWVHGAPHFSTHPRQLNTHKKSKQWKKARNLGPPPFGGPHHFRAQGCSMATNFLLHRTVAPASFANSCECSGASARVQSRPECGQAALWRPRQLKTTPHSHFLTGNGSHNFSKNRTRNMPGSILNSGLVGHP